MIDLSALPFTLPSWLPWWATLLLLLIALLYGLALLFMPFSIIGVKPRLEAIEARLDEVQAEIRSLVLRLPELPSASYGHEESYIEPERAAGPVIRRAPVAGPPIPPAPVLPAGQAPRGRAEPKLDWPR